MKKLLLMLMAAGGAASAIGQAPIPKLSHGDSLLSRWVIDVNLLGGIADQQLTTSGYMANYPNALNANAGKLNYKNGYAYGADAQIGFFWGHKRHFGVGTGFMFMQQRGDAIVDNFHIEYQATDGSGNIYRQVVTGHDIREQIVATSLSIPVVLKYKNRFSKHWGFTADAGAIVNLQTKNAYTTNASFDYEAIYKFTPNGDGGTTSVYDNSPVPSAGDWLITKAEFLQNNPNGNVQEYFAQKRALGYNVGEGIRPGKRTGSTKYTAGSIGLLLQPSFNLFLSDNVALNMGVYYMLQPFKNTPQDNYRLTDGNGTYSSVMNNATASTSQSYGLNLGARFFLGRTRTPIAISYTQQVSPSECGLADGGILLNGLTPGQPVTVTYNRDGKKQDKVSATVQPDGQVKIPNLAAGNYTDIVATIKRQNAASTPVTLTDPIISISSQKTTNPTAPAMCDGSMKFTGLDAGRTYSITYTFNGTAQPAVTGTVTADNSVVMSNLCEGKYTNIVAMVKHCTTNGTDFTLTAPVSSTTTTTTTTSTSTSTTLEYEGGNTDFTIPILFEVNKTTVRPASMPIIDQAAAELKENRNMNIIINGHADASGPEPANVILSENRAKAVKNELTKRGISPNRLRTKGHGSSMPAATNGTYEGKRENRRAVMTATPGK